MMQHGRIMMFYDYVFAPRSFSQYVQENPYLSKSYYVEESEYLGNDRSLYRCTNLMARISTQRWDNRVVSLLTKVRPNHSNEYPDLYPDSWSIEYLFREHYVSSESHNIVANLAKMRDKLERLVFGNQLFIPMAGRLEDYSNSLV